MAYAGNPNFANDYGAPIQYDKGPFAGSTPQHNPYGYGVQRVQGASTFQPNTYGFGGGTNTHYTDGMHQGGLGQYGGYTTPNPPRQYINPMAQAQGYTPMAHTEHRSTGTWASGHPAPMDASIGPMPPGPAGTYYAAGDPGFRAGPWTAPPPAPPVQQGLLGPESFPTPQAYQQYLQQQAGVSGPQRGGNTSTSSGYGY